MFNDGTMQNTLNLSLCMKIHVHTQISFCLQAHSNPIAIQFKSVDGARIKTLHARALQSNAAAEWPPNCAIRLNQIVVVQKSILSLLA